MRFVMRCIEEMHGGEIFVPKIPSMTILDLARDRRARCEVDVIGSRPGEKTHEILVSEDEARNTLELDDKFVILPHGPDRVGEGQAQGAPAQPRLSLCQRHEPRAPVCGADPRNRGAV